MASRKWLTSLSKPPVLRNKGREKQATVPWVRGRIRCNLIPFLLLSLSGTVGIAILGLLTGLALPKWLLHASSCMPIQRPIVPYLRAGNLQMTSFSRLPCRLYAGRH
jgi:hypothetical protein